MTTTITMSLPRLSDGIDDTLLRAVPEGVCRTFRVMPYVHHEGHILVAVADADDAITEHVVAERLDRPVILVRHTVHEILEVVDQAYPPVAAVVESTEARRSRMQMARMLTQSGLVDSENLRRAMLEHSRTGDPLGDILVSHGSISEDVLVAALSEIHQMQRVGLAEFEPDYDLARRLPEPLAQRLQVIPVAETDDVVLLAVARPLEVDDAEEVETALGRPFRQLLANRCDLDQLVQRVHSSFYADVATQFLVETHPERSAHVVVSGPQKVFAFTALAALVVGAVYFPTGTVIGLVAACSLLYFLVSVYKLRLTLRALGTHLETDVTDEEVATLDERSLPVYTILVPLYREAAVVPRLVRALDALDYPRSRLDVKLLCEEDDVETIDKVKGLALAPHFHLVVVPDGQPKTKPKACNYGLQLAIGSFCVIYDAEDRPDPDQLKKALIAFDRVHENVVCVQAKLNHFNADQNLLTSWFTNEYSMHFELVLPAMGSAESPIPLGGTSNHFKTSILRELGAWDPFNVTEDADLGMRLHRAGHRTAMIDSTTLEEANSQIGNWIRQRSRWNKGYFQTWLVHMRDPVRLLRETGVRGFVSFNLTMGSAFVLLLNPVFWFLTTLYLVSQWGLIETVFPSAVFYTSSLMLLGGNFVFIYLNVAGSLQRGDFGLTRTALLSPLYWGLMSYAAWRGFLQLFTNPFYWEKTEHGLDEAWSPWSATGTVLTPPANPPATTRRDRLAGVVQAVGRRPVDVPRRRWESLVVFGVFAAVYGGVGVYLVVDLHVVGFATLDRFDRALMIWHNDPPKLAAVGFDHAPLSVLLVAPATIVPALARSLVLVPVTSAVFAAATMVVLNTMMRRAAVGPVMRAVLLLTLGLNPLVLMYAAIGSDEFLWLAFAVAAVGALFAWYVTADVRFVMVAGLCYAVAVLTGYTSITWFAVSAVMIVAILARLGADGTEVEGTTVGFAAPTVYALTLWTALNLVILARPFHWLTSGDRAAGPGGLADHSPGAVASGVVQLVLYGAPLAVVVLPALLFAGVSRRNGFALWLGLLLAVTIFTPAVGVLLRITDSDPSMDDALPILLVSVIGAIWLARSAVAGSTVTAGLLAVGLLVSIPWTFHAMTVDRHQGLERAFHDALATGRSQGGATTMDGAVVGIDDEQQMASYIRAHVTDPGSILTDDAQTYAVVYLTGDPSLFFDRVDESDGPWHAAATDPAAHVQYLLLSTDPSDDLLSRLYPAAAAGDDPLLGPVFGDSRYQLVAVPSGYHYGDSRALDATVGSTGSPDSSDDGGCGASEAPTGGYGGQVGEPGSCATSTDGSDSSDSSDGVVGAGSAGGPQTIASASSSPADVIHPTSGVTP